MKRQTWMVAATAIGMLTAGAVRSDAGPDKISFPANPKAGVLYTVVDRYDIKQYRELYASQEAIQAAKAGQPLPSGTVLTLIQYKAQVDPQGDPLKDDKGRFLKGDLVGYGVMEKRTGWGTEYPDDLRNGEWEYAAFSADGKLNDKANYRTCFECHKPHEAQDFVISAASLKGGAGRSATGAADVTIAGFAFGPGTLTAAPGRAVTWVNTDDSPHQVMVTTGTPSRGPVMTKGQSYTKAFSAPGVYDYICGLHPSMKGQVEVK
jgi:plastocyanin